jgi:hypothetical protein
MQWIDRLSRRLGLPEWVVALGLVLGLDLALAGAVVAVASSASGGGSSYGTGSWTNDKLRNRFLMKSMDYVQDELGPAYHSSVASDGSIYALKYRLPTPDGLRDAYFFGRGNRCWDCGLEKH